MLFQTDNAHIGSLFGDDLCHFVKLANYIDPSVSYAFLKVRIRGGDFSLQVYEARGHGRISGKLHCQRKDSTFSGYRFWKLYLYASRLNGPNAIYHQDNELNRDYSDGTMKHAKWWTSKLFTEQDPQWISSEQKKNIVQHARKAIRKGIVWLIPKLWVWTRAKHETNDLDHLASNAGPRGVNEVGKGWDVWPRRPQKRYAMIPQEPKGVRFRCDLREKVKKLDWKIIQEVGMTHYYMNPTIVTHGDKSAQPVFEPVAPQSHCILLGESFWCSFIFVLRVVLICGRFLVL